MCWSNAVLNKWGRLRITLRIWEHFRMSQSAFSTFAFDAMSSYSEHDVLAIKYNNILQSGNPLLSRVSCSYSPSPCCCHTEVHGQEASVPLRDLWSSLARSGSAPLSRSWWGPRERPGTGSGHCMSSLDTQNRQKSVSDEGLEGNRGVESGTEYTWGFSYIGGSACNIPTSPPNLRALNQTHFLSHMASTSETHKLMGECFLCSPCLFLLSVLLSMDWGSNMSPEEAVFKYREHKNLKVWCTDWPDVNFLYALAARIWFSDGKTCHRKSMGKATRM